MDPRRMQPAKLVQLLNSNPFLGEVVTAGRLRRHRLAAGFLISSDGDTVDVLKYAAWLVAKRHKTNRKEKPKPSTSIQQEAIEAGRRLRALLAKRQP